MVKRLLTLTFALAAFMLAWAQMPQLTPLPLNPSVKAGKLANGLSYYILHNEEPKERANFYIAQKVGSTLEAEDQLGLAHFLEHMAFNGTKQYPGKNMLNYLQSKGLRFGADINAYTAFDETVYNINGVPTTDQKLMDSVLLVLHDWSCDLLLEDQEIEAERGVIQEEWRQRNDANFRMLSSILPQIYEEYQYEQTPIGKMEVVMNFKPETLRAYYKKWYRPDQQGIVIVGDFDAAAMEKKVKEIFSPIAMPVNATTREYPQVSDNEKPIYASFTDPELSAGRVTVSFKSDVVPFDIRNTVEIYVNHGILQTLIEGMLNTRIGENAQKPDCNYTAAGVNFGEFYVSKTKNSFDVAVLPKPGKNVEALAEVMGIVARAFKAGFNDSELELVKTQMLSNYETTYNDRGKITNGQFGKELTRFFIDNEPAPGIETEYQLVQQVLPNISVEMINQVVKGILTPNNMVIVETMPEKDGFKVVGEDVLVKTVNNAMNAEYEAFEDQKITEPLISNLPKAGKVKGIKDTAFGMKEVTLSNGIKVYLKPTELASDQIMVAAWRDGGLRSLDPKQYKDAKMLAMVASTAKRGPFDNKMLPKYLAGKQAAIGVMSDNYSDYVSGNSSVKGLPALMELIYANFTELNPDKETYGVKAENAKTRIRNSANDPMTVFGEKRSSTLYPGDELNRPMKEADIDAADYDAAFNIMRGNLANAADYTFLFTGNIDEKTIVPLLEQYIATLPAAKPRKVPSMDLPKLARGNIKEHWQQPMQTPGTTVFDVYSGDNVACNVRNNLLLELMTEVLTDVYTQTLREEEGGTYGAGVGGSIDRRTGMWTLIYSFQTNKDQQQALIDRAHAELLKMIGEGANPETFAKVKEAAIKQYEIAVNQNNYWHTALGEYLRGNDIISNYEQTLKGITVGDLNEFMKHLWDGKNRIQIIMEGVEAK